MTRLSLASACPLALLCCLLATGPAEGASKIAIAALGDPAPGGGAFAGPPFSGEPSAAGNGWLAFRAQGIGSTVEQIVARNMLTTEDYVVATVGGIIDEKIGRIKQFLGRPTVNVRGDVAFAAEITPPDDAPKPDPLAPPPPPPAGVFLWNKSQEQLSVVAEPGLDTGLGILDLTTPINLLTVETGIDIAERTPALNDAGDVAFVAATLDDTTPGGAIFVRRAGQPLAPVVTLRSAYENGRFQILGPPAINNAGMLAFRAVVEGATALDGIFKLEAGALSLLIKDGDTPDKLPAPFTIDPIFEFGDVVALNDAGDVVCTGGPFFDNSDDSSFADLDGSPGVILLRPGASPLLVGFPGQRVEVGSEREGRIFELTLGPEEGSRTAAPALTPDGKVIFFSTVSNGSSQAIFRVDPAGPTPFTLVRLGGTNADAAPRVGGTYLSASSSPAVDAAGNIAFAARIEGSTTSEALVWQPSTGDAEAITIGDAAPDPVRAYFAGPAFFPPVQNDAGDIVFKSHVARGPSSLGVFRFRDGALSAVVRVRDPAPLADAPLFTNLVGDLSMNGAGDVAFAATVAGRGRGIFLTSGDTVRAVAMQLDELVPEDPLRLGAFIRTIATNASVNESGTVVFRGVVSFQSPFGPFVPDERQNCLFLADASGVHVVVAQGDDSGTGLPFLNFRDPVIVGESILFRGTLGTILEEGTGFFLRDERGVRPVVVKGQDLGDGMIVSTLQGKALLGDNGDVLFAARVERGSEESGVVMRATAAGLQPILQTGARGPDGGRIRSLGRLSVNREGNVALRLGFEPFSGGVPGVFLARPGGPESYLRVGEGGAAGINGRITNLNQNVALNSSDRVAFLASVGGGEARSAIFLAAPTTMRVEKLAFRRGPGLLSENAPLTPRDRVRFSAVLEPPDIMPQPPPSPERGQRELARARRKLVTVAVADGVGPLWSGIVQSADTQLRGRTLRSKRGADSRVGALRVRFTRRGAIRVAVRSRPFDLSVSAGAALERRFDETGAAILEPPFIVRVDVGEDGGSATLDCTPRGRRFGCG